MSLVLACVIHLNFVSSQTCKSTLSLQSKCSRKMTKYMNNNDQNVCKVLTIDFLFIMIVDQQLLHHETAERMENIHTNRFMKSALCLWQFNNKLRRAQLILGIFDCVGDIPLVQKYFRWYCSSHVGSREDVREGYFQSHSCPTSLPF